LGSRTKVDNLAIAIIAFQVFEVRQTETFRDWLADMRDAIAVKAIRRRMVRVQAGLFGDARSVGGGVHELRVDHGPGYRVYFARRGAAMLLLLCGGDKASQTDDIARAKILARQWME
jgi:putative addiction module killer protein